MLSSFPRLKGKAWSASAEGGRKKRALYAAKLYQNSWLPGVTMYGTRLAIGSGIARSALAGGSEALGERAVPITGEADIDG